MRIDMDGWGRAFALALFSSGFGAFAIFQIILLPPTILTHVVLILSSMALFASITLYRVFNRELQKRSLSLSALRTSQGYFRAKWLGVTSGIILTGFWLATLGIALSADAPEAMVGQLLAPVIIIMIEWFFQPSDERKVRALFLSFVALLFCLGAALVFQGAVEAKTASSVNLFDKESRWLFIPAAFSVSGVLLLICAEARLSGNFDAEAAKAVFRISESASIAICSFVIWGYGAGPFLHQLTLGHFEMTTIGSEAVLPLVLVYIACLVFGWPLGLLISWAVVFHDRARRLVGTGGAAALETIDAYVTIALGLVLYLIYYYPARISPYPIPLTRLFDPTKYDPVVSLLGWFGGAFLLLCAAVILYFAWDRGRNDRT
jgi:hypothetical protein